MHQYSQANVSGRVIRILTLEWQAHIQMVTNSHPQEEIRPDQFGQASSQYGIYGRFVRPCAYPYQWDEQKKRFADKHVAVTADSLDIISSSEEEKESDSGVDSSDEGEMTKRQTIATDKLSKIRNGTMFKNRIDASHGGQVKRSVQQCKSEGQKKAKAEISGM